MDRDENERNSIGEMSDLSLERQVEFPLMEANALLRALQDQETTYVKTLDAG